MRAQAPHPEETSLWSFVAPYQRAFYAGGALLLLTNVCDKAIPYLMQIAIDGLVDHELEVMKRASLLVVTLAAVLWLVRTKSRIVVFNIGRDVEHDVRSALLRKLHTLGPRFFRKMPVGEVMSRATNDIAQVRLLVGFGGLNVFNTIFAFGGALILMWWISPTLTLWALLPFPLVILVAQVFGRAIYDRSRETQEALGELSEVAQENLAGVRVVRAFSIEATERERFEEVNERAVQTNMRLVILRGLMWPILMFVSSLGNLIVLWKGGEMVLAGDGSLSVGQFAAFNAYLAQLVWPTLALGYLLSIVQRGRASYKRVQVILESTPDVENVADPQPLSSDASVRIEDLTFTYPSSEEPVLRDVSLFVPAQQSLAIMGTVGSGKSTLASLIPRLQETPEGTIFVGETDVTQADLRELRDTVAFAQQEPFLFSTTVRQNIAFSLADPRAPDADARIQRAAEEACVWEEILLLPEGLETLVGERGVQLSGGQKQRVALARALLSEPKVLVLDDPMSAVDAQTESTILEAIDRAKRGRTLILVTHRVAAASRCDQIVVLDRGRVVERGSHQALLAAGGLYASLAEKQSLEAELGVLAAEPQRISSEALA